MRCAVARLATLAAAVALPLAVRSPAQERSVVHAPDNGPRVAVATITPYGGSSQTSGLGFVFVDIQSDSDRPLATRVVVRSSWRGSGPVEVERALELGPRESARYWLPLPNVQGGGSFRLLTTIDGADYEDTIDVPRTGSVGLYACADPKRLADAVRFVQGLPHDGTDPPRVEICPGEQLPTDWRLLTGFDVVLVDGSRVPPPAAAQEALRRYAMAGGLLVVAASERLPGGPLRDLCRQVGPDAAYGLGRCVAIGDLRSAVIDPRAQLDITSGTAARPAQWPFDGDFVQSIPGLDAAPVRVFLVVMLLFAVLAGPVNFLVLKRRRRPMLALVTVPLLGLGTTAAMLLFGFLNDGLGVRGVVHSLTLLDQRSHEAATIAVHTLFAGLAPGPLALDEDRLLLAPRATDRTGRRTSDRWAYDAAAGVLRGVLPSRIPTPLVDARQGTARERLRVQRAGGELRVLTDGGIAPLGELVVRTPDGAYWVGIAPTLRSLDASTAPGIVDRLLGFALLWNGDGSVGRLGASASAVLAGRDLAPGCYLARVAAPPGVTPLSFTVDYGEAAHVVAGILAEEDVLR